MSENEHIINVLKSSAAFESLPQALLAEIASVGRPAHYRAGETIYELGAAADDIFLILEGEVEHSFDPDTGTPSELVKTVGPGAVFGWAALLDAPDDREPRQRLAKTVSLTDSSVLIINAQSLVGILDSIPGAQQSFRDKLTSMVRHLYGFAGFVQVHDKRVPAYIPSSDPRVPHDYDTFAF